MRTVFGALYTSIKNNNKPFYDFFTNEYEASMMSFTPDETVLMAEALNKNTFLSEEDKLEYFNKYFAGDFVTFMEEYYKENDLTKTTNIMDQLSALGYYDERVWNALFNRFWKYKGGKRLQAYEIILKYASQFELAAEISQFLRQELSRSADVKWRYNFDEGRYYTNW